MGARLSVPTRAPFRGPATKTVTFVASTTGLQGAVTDVFTVTGEVIVIYLVPFCATSLDQSAGTPKLMLGTPTDPDLFVNSTTATLIDAGNFWTWANPSFPMFALPDRLKETILSEKIVCEVDGSNNISAGVIRFDAYWLPMSPDGYLAAA